MKTTLESLRITKFKYDNIFLSKGTRFTLEYLIKIVEKLKPMDKSTENRVLEKLLSFLTHQWVTISDSMANSTDSWSMSTRNSDVVDEDHHWGTMKLGMSAKLYAFVRNIQQKLASNSTSWPRNSSELIFFFKWLFGFRICYVNCIFNWICFWLWRDMVHTAILSYCELMRMLMYFKWFCFWFLVYFFLSPTNYT